MSTAATTARPDYGLDAPGTVRNLLVIGGGLLAVFASTAAGLWSGVVGGVPVAFMAVWPGAALALTGLGMLYTSKVGKVRGRERLLDRVTWTGAETVLDVGCGRGLMLVGAAKRLTTGRAVGIDVWQAADLSGNTPDAPVENARREGVADRVETRTADMREIPLADSSVDVVVSCSAVHNLYAQADRAKALAEIVRVMKPGGRLVLDDIRHGREYAAALRTTGCPDARTVGVPVASALWGVVTLGAFRPATVVATKAAGR